MDLQELMSELESLGTAQNRKIYARHGAGENQFGVSFADLNRLQKRTKTDHELALELWETGNCDARTLAPMIANPGLMERYVLDRWLLESGYYVVSDAVARHLASKIPLAHQAAECWIDSPHEWTSRCGWMVIAIHAGTAPDQGGLPDEYFLPFIDRIENEIHTAPNRTRDAMNMTICAFGIYRAGLRKAALAAAGRIGRVVVDHGQTGCKTPDAATYIMKAVHRKTA